jgi:hypothetical protein
MERAEENRIKIFFILQRANRVPPRSCRSRLNPPHCYNEEEKDVGIMIHRSLKLVLSSRSTFVRLQPSAPAPEFSQYIFWKYQQFSRFHKIFIFSKDISRYR